MHGLVDVHTHLTDKVFADDLPEVISAAVASGVKYMISNGLNPTSNRRVLEISATYESVLPALGIYPIDAVNDRLPSDFPLSVNRFDVDDEIKFISDCASKQHLIAVGECGLDGHWIKEETFERQEFVFESLIEIAIRNEIPLIIHTRKLEKRAVEILIHHQVQNVNFHCFGGKSSLAIEVSKKYGWWFSIPANARKNESFTKMIREMPKERLLTETDAPYLAPERGKRNVPENIPGTVKYFAELWSTNEEAAAAQIGKNFEALFGGALRRLVRFSLSGQT